MELIGTANGAKHAVLPPSEATCHVGGGENNQFIVFLPKRSIGRHVHSENLFVKGSSCSRVP